MQSTACIYHPLGEPTISFRLLYGLLMMGLSLS
jgi:hypothetical protein